eukprot:scaffold62859_cov66-Attheya_sp.AAC.4
MDLVAQPCQDIPSTTVPGLLTVGGSELIGYQVPGRSQAGRVAKSPVIATGRATPQHSGH